MSTDQVNQIAMLREILRDSTVHRNSSHSSDYMVVILERNYDDSMRPTHLTSEDFGIPTPLGRMKPLFILSVLTCCLFGISSG